MSLNASKELVDLIDSRITAKKFQRVAVVESVSEDNKKAVVRFPETDTTFEYFNKTSEVLKVGDSVYVASNDGDLMNGYIQNRFGESSWLVAGKDIEIGDGVVDGDNLADGAVGTGHIADGAIIGSKIADFTVDNAKIGFASIDTANIRDATITTAKIQDAAITNAKIENLSVTTAKIQDAAITNAKIGNAEIDNAKIAVAAIDTANIKNAAITSACIATEAVGTSQIADGSITDAKIVSLTADKLTAGTIDAGTIDVVNLNASSITVGKINGVQIEDGAIGLTKLDAIVNDKITTAQETADGKNTTYYSNEKPTGGIYVEGDIWFDRDDGYKIYTYDGNDFVAMPLGSGAIDDSAITATKLSDGSVTGVKMVEGAITSREIQTGAITADELAANSVTANAIETKSINASHIDTSTITADKLLLGDSTSYSTIDMLLYVPDDWTDWTNITVPEITQDSNKFIKTAQTTDTDLPFSLPYSSSILATNVADNEFGFSFTISNSSGTDKTVLLNAYFFDSTKKFLSKTTIDTLSLLSTETSKKIESIKTFVPALNSKYFCFGISIADGFSCGIKSIQIRKTMGTTFISDGAITTGKIVSNAITAAKIASKTITANEIVSNTITSNEIAAGAITADEIAAEAVTAAKIKAGEITTDHLASNVGETLDISSNTSITSIVSETLNGETIVSRINMTPSTVKIEAKNIVFDGYATFTVAQSYATTAENNAKTAAQGYATTAQNNATSSASTYASNARTGAVSDVSTKLSTAGQTTINGGNITTGTISASRLDLSGYATFTSLSTAGSTTINGSNITTGTISASRISFTGALNGYSSGNSTGISISSSGLIQVPNGSSFMLGGATLTGNTQGSGGLTISSSGTDISINPGSSYYSKVYNLNATSQPYNIPKTADTGSSEKINKITFKPGTGVSDQYLQLDLASTINGSASKGITAWNSDIRHKGNISATTYNALEEIQKIKIRQYTWIDNNVFEPFGIVAQEIEKVSDRFVLKVPSDTGIWYQLKTHEFIPLIIKSTQELNSQLTQAQNEISILKSKTDAYDQIIHEMRLEIEKLKNGVTIQC